jgi:hypothetical protein
MFPIFAGILLCPGWLPQGVAFADQKAEVSVSREERGKQPPEILRNISIRQVTHDGKRKEVKIHEKIIGVICSFNDSFD